MSLAALLEEDGEALDEELPPDTERDPDGAGSRDQRRSARHHEVRAETIALRDISQLELEVGRRLYGPSRRRLPLTRGECEIAPRPCLYVSCRYNLFLDVSKGGGIKLNFPDLEPDEQLDSCALDVAEAGGHTLEEVGAILNITRERLRQIENEAFEQLAAVPGLREHLLEVDSR